MSQTEKKHEGLPMSEKSFKEWQKAFSDMEESIALLYKTEKKGYNKNVRHKGMS